MAIVARSYMKPPQFSLRQILLAIATCAAVLGFARFTYMWVTWPKRTASEFQSFLFAGELEKAEQMMEIPPLTLYDWRTTYSESEINDRTTITSILKSRSAPPRCAALSRSLFDVIRGEQEFSTIKDNTLIIRRGRIIGIHRLAITHEGGEDILFLL
jgi:hypothetical protein